MKELLVFQGPVSSRSGYGDHSRDIVRSLLSMDRFEILIADTNWGACPRNGLKEGDVEIKKRIMQGRELNRQPDIFMQCSVPNEFRNIGKFNIGITAGIETTICSPEWLEGLNRMDLNIVPSEHSKNVFKNVTWDRKDKNTGQVVGNLVCEKPVEVLFEGVDTKVFNHKIKVPEELSEELSSIKENFCFLVCGHWLQGGFGHDRKDIATTLKVFLETFKKNPSTTRPGLILKTSSATFSVIDREQMLEKIQKVVESTGIKNPPNIYLLHGDLTAEEMNGLYNHPKVKAMVSFTKGEGYGRPLAEFSTSGKPILVSNWSGHLDFCKHVIKLPGELKNVHDSAAWDKMILKDSKWFYVNSGYASRCMKEVFKKYKKFLGDAKKQRALVSKEFDLETMTKDFQTIFKKFVPQKAEIKLPKLKLPKLKQKV